jgi:hypothetical protein
VESNNYAKHLSGVNESRKVYASAEIKNQQGQLIVPKGQAIDQKTTKQILRFKLLKPLELNIQIENTLNAQTLERSIDHFFHDDQSLRQLWLKENIPELIQTCCERLCDYPILCQKLTVLQIQFPEVFNRAIFCAWFAVIILNKQNAADKHLIGAFVAGMLCDIGLLHIEPKLATDQSDLSIDELKQYQAHPLISGEILRNTKDIPKGVYRAVEEHHESADASGFPKGKISKEISSLAQTLGLLDACYQMYFSNLKNKTQNISDIAPLIQINPQYRINNEAATLVMMLKQVKAREECFTPAIYFQEYISLVENKHKYVFKFINSATELNDNVGYTHQKKRLLGLQNILLHICLSVNQSGLINDAYLRWLQQVKQDKLEFAYREVEDVSLMLTEVIYHCERFINSLKLILNDEENESGELAAFLDDAYKKLIKLRSINIQPKGPTAEYFL